MEKKAFQPPRTLKGIISEALIHNDDGDLDGTRDYLCDALGLLTCTDDHHSGTGATAKACIHPEASQCVDSCYQCDPESDPKKDLFKTMDVMDRSIVEDKLLNIRAYASLIEDAMQNTAPGTIIKLPEDWKTMSGRTWENIHVMLYHIKETLNELISE